MSNNLEYNLSLRNAFSPQINQARSSLGQFQRSVNSVDGSKINSLGQNFAGLATKIAAAFTAWHAGMAVFSGIGKSLNLAADMESTQVAFKTLVGSSTKATEVLGKLKKLGAETPFEFPELANAGRMLIAFGESADTVPDSLRRIGDVASGIQAPIGEIAEIYGKARTQGTLFAEDINQLTGRGIPIIGQFAKILGVSEGAVKDLASEGKITFTLLDQAFRNMTATGGQFHNMMQEQSGTSNGLISTLKDGVNELFLAFGQPISEALKPILKDAISLVGRLQPMIASLGQAMAPALTAIRNFIAEAESGGNVVTMLGTRLKEAFLGLADVAMVPFRIMAAGIPGLGAALMKVLIPVGDYLALKFESIALLFGRTIMQKMSEVMAAMPPLLVGDAPIALNKAANDAGKGGNKLSGQADSAAASLPGALKEASDELMKGVVAMKQELSKELDRFSLKTGGPSASPKTDAPGSVPPSADAPGIGSAIAKANEAGGNKGGKTKAAAEGKLDSNSRYDEDGRRRSDGRRRIVSARDGSTVAKRSERSMTDQPGISDQLQAAKMASRFTKEGAKGLGMGTLMNGFKPGEGLMGASATPDGLKGRLMDGSTKAKQTRGLDSLYGGDRALKKPGSPNFTPPNPELTPPGMAKAQSQDRREAAATAQRGSVEKSRWDAVVAIEKKLASLGLAS